MPVALAVVCLGAVAGRRTAVFLGIVALAAAGSGHLAVARDQATLTAELPHGSITMAGRVLSDPVLRWDTETVTVKPTHLLRGDVWVDWHGPRLLVTRVESDVAAGERVVVTGTVKLDPMWVRGDAVAGELVARSIEALGNADDPLFAAGNLVRDRIHDGLERFGHQPAAALLTGFLIGDVRDLPTSDVQALRRTGLTHFVAVSGSNVALFLAAWWVATGPLGWGPRRRAVVGLVGLALFVVITRWEPSVVRAATMASIVLVGRAAGIAVDGWMAYGGANALLLLVSGDLAVDAGFQMSAAATAGVLVGAGMWSDRRPRWMWMALAATVAAQAAVAPLLLLHFGSIPLAAPLTNLIAGPLVAASTTFGGIGVISGLVPMTSLGVATADAVLAVARTGQDLPQLGWAGVAGLVGVMALMFRRGLRPLVTLGAAGALAVVILLPARLPAGPELTVLDVGQGDSILLRDSQGTVILVDGGPDPGVLRRHLTKRGIDRIDLLVITHQHADHTTGLQGITGYSAVGRVWHPAMQADADVASGVLAEVAALGSQVEVPVPGWMADVGDFHITVLGPLRRYASPNDGSLVLLVEAVGRVALLAGDIETIAQRELGVVEADILKVPHQGAATSDLDWLADVGASVAVISVGPNTFGHPDDDVVRVLEEAGALVRRTDQDGDVAVRFDLVGVG